MPQMSPLWWTFIIILTISLLFITSSFLYFMVIPSPNHFAPYRPPFPSLMFKWLW